MLDSGLIFCAWIQMTSNSAESKHFCNFPQKNSGWGGGGVYYTRPSLPISIKYKQEGVGIWVNNSFLIKNTMLFSAYLFFFSVCLSYWLAYLSLFEADLQKPEFIW
jgi:hypothetical protein